MRLFNTLRIIVGHRSYCGRDHDEGQCKLEKCLHKDYVLFGK